MKHRTTCKYYQGDIIIRMTGHHVSDPQACRVNIISLSADQHVKSIIHNYQDAIISVMADLKRDCREHQGKCRDSKLNE